MITTPDINNIEILCLPDYLVNTLHSRNMNVGNIVGTLDKYAITNMSTDNFFNIYKDKLSKQDMEDALCINQLMKQDFGIETKVLDYPDLAVYSKTINDIIAINKDDKVNLNEIIMRSNKASNTDVPFYFRSGNFSILVVLEKGFFNYKTNNVVGFDFYFLNILFCYMLKMFGSKRTYQHPLFSSFNKKVFVNQSKYKTDN